MATFKLTGGVSHFYDKLVNGMVARGYSKDFTERTFKQIEGFGSYGFPENHAASFAKIAYASCWMKHCVTADRRQGLWKVKRPGEAPLPLFAAADEREAQFSPEERESDVSLRPMTDGREVVQDYRMTQLSLRAHPISFLRAHLTDMKIVRCSDLANIRDGRNVEVGGMMLVRQRPGSAKGVLFITIEDETGIAKASSGPTNSRSIAARSCHRR